jgi:CrcB protein
VLNYILISVGAALGGAFRYWLSNAAYRFFPTSFPYGTLAINIIGSFILGLIIFIFDERELISSEVKIFLTIGFCGGLTTFYAFSFETFILIQESEYLLAALNIFLSILLCVAGILLGSVVSKII